MIDKKRRSEIIKRIEQEEETIGFVDYITISSSLLFSMKYVISIDELKKQTFYNNVRLKDYEEANDYLEGITIVSDDYKKIFDKYKDVPNVVFLVDPPYLSTTSVTYSNYWKLSDYLNVLTILRNKCFIYFTSNKSQIIELCEWMENNKTIGNPFKHCERSNFNARMNYNSTYTGIMMVNQNKKNKILF